MATWIYRNGDDTATNWYTTMNGVTASYGLGVTGSWDGRGGSWYTGSVVTQSFSYTLEDINLDVTEFVKKWNSGSIGNNGFILKFPNNKELDTIDYGTIKMFSKETNTIYQPIQVGHSLILQISRLVVVMMWYIVVIHQT